MYHLGHTSHMPKLIHCFCKRNTESGPVSQEVFDGASLHFQIPCMLCEMKAR